MSPDGRPVTAAKGLVLGAHAAVTDAPELEVLVPPAGRARARYCVTPPIWTGCASNAERFR